MLWILLFQLCVIYIHWCQVDLEHTTLAFILPPLMPWPGCIIDGKWCSGLHVQLPSAVASPALALYHSAALLPTVQSSCVREATSSSSSPQVLTQEQLSASICSKWSSMAVIQSYYYDTALGQAGVPGWDKVIPCHHFQPCFSILQRTVRPWKRHIHTDRAAQNPFRHDEIQEELWKRKKKVKKTWVYEYICKVWRLEASAASQTARFFFSPTLGTFYLVTALCLELSPPCSYIQHKIWSKKKNYANWKAASELSSVCALLAVQLM